MAVEKFIPNQYSHAIPEGEVTWQSPSNIALVKYWGKKDGQIPANPSISFTLDFCRTTTGLAYEKRKVRGEDFSFDLFFEQERKESFKPKILQFFNRIDPYLPFLKDLHFTINTSNSFPHSSGIASSASGMSALALCLMQIEKEMTPEMTEEHFRKKASFLARLGSGSACRSIEGGLVVWGDHETAGSSDLYGVKYPYEVHEVFQDFQDVILLVDKGEKQVSSTVGHNLMNGHPFAEQRFQQAHVNLSQLREILKCGDLEEFIKIVESEALTLHAMMLSSQPYFLLMKPNTLAIIQKVFRFRQENKLHLCFTLDAGANVHLLFPKQEKEAVENFIEQELKQHCQDGQFIRDQVGRGAEKVAKV